MTHNLQNGPLKDMQVFFVRLLLCVVSSSFVRIWLPLNVCIHQMKNPKPIGLDRLLCLLFLLLFKPQQTQQNAHPTGCCCGGGQDGQIE